MTNADEESYGHEDERYDVSQHACTETLTDGALQRDAVAHLEGGVVPPNIDELLFALAAAAEPTSAATAASRRLQDAYGHVVRSDAFHDALVSYGLSMVHFRIKMHKGMFFFA